MILNKRLALEVHETDNYMIERTTPAVLPPAGRFLRLEKWQSGMNPIKAIKEIELI